MNTPETPQDPQKDLVLIERSQLDKEADDKMVLIDTVLDLKNMEPKSVIVLRIGGDAGHKMRMHQAFVRFVQSKGDLFKQKELTVMFLEPGDYIDVLTEEDMDKAGWVKKDKSLIITP